MRGCLVFILFLLAGGVGLCGLVFISAGNSDSDINLGLKAVGGGLVIGCLAIVLLLNARDRTKDSEESPNDSQ